MDHSFQESIQELFTNLILHNLTIHADETEALVLHRRYNSLQVRKLKKILYHRLCLTLHSPYVLPNGKDDSLINSTNDSNVFSGLAEISLSLQVEGKEKDAIKLNEHIEIIRNLNDDTVENVIRVLLLLSNTHGKQKCHPERLCYEKVSTDDVPFFQFDQKALNMINNSVNHFGRITDDEGENFVAIVTSAFTLPPGSFFSGATSSFLKKSQKESKHSLLSRTTLFGGLTTSFSTSMEVALSLPELPHYPAKRELVAAARTDDAELSIDEGFDEPSRSSTNSTISDAPAGKKVNIWDEALSAGELKIFAWEKTDSYDHRSESLYISELGDKAFDCMYNIRLSEVERIIGRKVEVVKVPWSQIYRDSLHALIGIPSKAYIFYPMSCSLKPKANIHCSGVSIEGLTGFLAKFAQVGTHYRQLNKFCQHHSDKPTTGISGGLILRSFIEALKEILYSYWSAVFMAEGIDGLTLMELWGSFDVFGRQLKFLADICLCSEAFKRTSRNSPKPKFPVGANLLSYLYSLAVKNSSTEQYHLLLYLFKSVSIPFIRLVTDWLFDGVCNDLYNEFFVHTDQQYLCYRDKYFWTQGFQMKQSKEAIPLFLGDLADQIFACGKAINLLKLTNIHHYLFERSIVVPNISVTFSSVKLDSIEQKCQQYIKDVDEMKKKDKRRKEMERLEEEEDWKNKLKAEKTITQNMIKRIEELELQVKAAIRDKKNDAYTDLKAQFEVAMQERKGRRLKKLEEDKYWMDEMKKMEEKDDEMKHIARQELISFYEELSRKAEAREFHAHWIIRRHELTEKRKFFMQSIEESLKEEHESIKYGSQAAISFDEDVITDTIDGQKSNLFAHEEVDATITSLDVISGDTSTELAMLTETVRDCLDVDATDKVDVVHEKSEAKDVLYPSTNEPLTSSYTDQYMIDGSTGETRQLLGSSAHEGMLAKNILYPSSSHAIEDITKPNTSNVEGEETKRLLYPDDVKNDEVIFQLRQGDHCEDGDETKNLLYPVHTNPQENISFTKRVHTDDGKETKEILYPTQLNPDTSFTGTRGRENDEGKEAKELLYPTNIVPDKPFTSTRACERDEGKETKELLYPITCIMSKPKIIHRSEGAETKCLLYPTDEGSVKTESVRINEFRSEGNETKHLLYPTEGIAFETFVSTRGQKIEGTNAKETLYPSKLEVSVTSDAKLSALHDEGREAKDLLYPSTIIDNYQHVTRHFEPASTMQNILYPSEEREETMKKVSKGFEPPTKIKKMMYPSIQRKEHTKYEERVLTKEEVWMDSIVEPFRDEYSVLDMEPQPYLFGDTNRSIAQHFSPSEPEHDIDVMKRLPLETIIKRSLTIPILAQVTLVNSAVIKYFLEDLNIEVHFDAFRKFLLLEDGEFGHSLCSQLFEKISSGMNPQDFCNTIRLNNIVIEALRLSLYASRIEYSRQLAFSLKWMPEVFHGSDVGALDFLELRYRVPWPCNIIVTENSITKYNKVFSFLLKLKKAGWSLQEVWVNLKKAGHNRVSASSPQLRQLQLYRHEMQHFVNNLERYIVNQIIHVSWTEFQHDLRNKVNSLDDLHRCHVNYLNKIIFRSLLSKNAAPVYKLINDIFGMIAKFEARLLTTPWQRDQQSGYVTHPLFSKLRTVHGAFKQCGEFLFSVISKLVRRGYQDHLDDLLLQVNFNAYYTTAVVKK